MEDNPYRSPESVPEGEKRPSPPDSPWPETLWVRAVLYGFMAMGGFVVLQGIIVDILWPTVAPLNSPIAAPPELVLKRVMMYALYAVLASPVGVLMAWWTWRVPNSKRTFLVAVCLGMSTAVLALILGALFSTI